LQAAIPVAAVLGGGIAGGDPVAGVTMGAGAMLVGIAWRTGGGRPPLALMATDATFMAVSTFVGCVTGSVSWLHLVVLGVWSLLGGLLVALGRRGAVVGTQAIIAVIVFGRFNEPAPAALGLAGLVFAGGCAQVLFLTVGRWSAPLRAQRGATAGAFRALSELAGAASDASTLPAAAALDEAARTLASPSLFGDSAVMTLRSLVDEGRRMRVALSAIHALRARPLSLGQAAEPGAAEPQEAALSEAVSAMGKAAHALELAAAAIEGDAGAAVDLGHRVIEFGAAVAALGTRADTATLEPDSALAAANLVQLTRGLSALGGQLRAVAGLAPAAGERGGLRSRRPHRSTNQPVRRLQADLALIVANARLGSPAGRHALRLAVVVLVAQAIARQLPLQHSYWMVVAAATVLRPEFGATFTRGTERALGTLIGVGLAGAIAVGLHPAGAVTAIIVGLLAWAGYATFPASFAVGFAFITALVVFLLNVISPDTLSTAGARLVDTLAGGSLGLIAYAIWPTWTSGSARESLAELVGALRAYLAGVLSAVIEGRPLPGQEVRALARQARLARTNAEATVARSLSEPPTRRIDVNQALGALGAMRRLVQAAHVLRLDLEANRGRRSLAALAPVQGDIDLLLGVVQARLQTGSDDDEEVGTLPDLRAELGAFERVCPHDRDGVALLAELDEIVDATNGLAALAGLDPVDSLSAQPVSCSR
jgi:uncharacterized membrane protein YccC